MGDEQVIPGADPMHLLGQKTPNLERIVDIHGRIEEAGVLQVGKGHVKNDLAGGVLRGPSIGGTAGYAIPTRPRSAQSVEVEYDPLATGMGFLGEFRSGWRGEKRRIHRGSHFENRAGRKRTGLTIGGLGQQGDEYGDDEHGQDHGENLGRSVGARGHSRAIKVERRVGSGRRDRGAFGGYSAPEEGAHQTNRARGRGRRHSLQRGHARPPIPMKQPARGGPEGG